MEASLTRGWAIPRRIVLLGSAVGLILIAAFVGVLWWAGPAAAVALGMGFLVGTRPAISLTARHAIALALPAALAGAVAVGLRGQPFVAACFVALCCLLIAPAGIHQAGLLAGMPTVAAVLVSVPGVYESVATAAWMIAGSLLLVAISVVVKAPRSKAAGVPPKRALRHAAVMAASVGVVVYFAQTYEFSHGYWVAVTLTVVLQPQYDLTRQKARQRVVGTVGGVVLALVSAEILPPWGVAVALAVCLILMNCYAIVGDYVRQVVFLTAAIVLLAPAGGIGVVAIERAVATLIGTLLAGVLAVALERTEATEPGSNGFDAQ